VLAEHVAEAVLADDQKQRSADADERVRTQAGGLLTPLALQPDQRREPERKRQLPDLLEPLTAWKRCEQGQPAQMPEHRDVPGGGANAPTRDRRSNLALQQFLILSMFSVYK
jgi:hypothetical protein